MERIISETPQKWVIIKFTDLSKDPQQSHTKVFGSWAGSYLEGDSWRLNSGIKSIDEDEEYYYINGHSGSCYKCKKGMYGTISSYSETVLNNILSKSTETMKIELMDESIVKTLLK